jgi:hypothetical protein
MESRRAGFDIGMDRAIREWLHKSKNMGNAGRNGGEY